DRAAQARGRRRRGRAPPGLAIDGLRRQAARAGAGVHDGHGAPTPRGDAAHALPPDEHATPGGPDHGGPESRGPLVRERARGSALRSTRPLAEDPVTSVWEFAAAEGRSGTGNWEAFDRGLDEVRRAAEPWKQALRGCEKPWLCWNLNDRWSLVQQKLVRSVGWTPVVGWDPSNGVGCPPLIPEAIAIDFNADLKLPTLWVHVPLEFAFLWTERLAF